MANDGFEFNELDDFARDLLDLANNTMPRESKKFMNKQGAKLTRKTKANAKSMVKKKTGNYHRSIKKGKVYKHGATGGYAIRTYSSAPHAHLIEYGHRQVINGVEVGFTAGKKVFGKTKREYEGEFVRDAQDFIDDCLEKGLS